MEVALVGFLVARLLSLAASDPNRIPMTENILTQEYLTNLKNSGYNRNIMPDGNHGYGSPVEVLCTMHVLDVTKVDDRNMDYRVTMYFRQSWNDSRLSFLEQDIHSVVLNDPKHIWTPDLFFVQEKEGYHHSITIPNTFIRINPEGEVLYSIRISVTLSCPMDFHKFPHDKQKCVFMIESYGRTRDKLELSWDRRRLNPPITVNEYIPLLPFDVREVKENVRHAKFTFGEYTALEVGMIFERKMGFFLTRLYIPFLLLVALSWVSFWIPAQMIALRLSLLFVLLYMMITIASGISDYLPPSSYTKGSDVWIAVCETMVFAAFIQFIALHIIARKRMRKNDPEAQTVLDLDHKMNAVMSEATTSAVNIAASGLKWDALSSKRIDRACAALFPILFVAFNLVYWLVYCTGH
ncbi:glycine receptor subunit alpha-2 [Trichonephila inaurata madagascariensis]|uniref:Glycine receptor subunit alpha-2 n=1 Tax=Trichonephila inaurata madagascariensis TaxID=2747483 RepID=A0A8X6XL20_9ARAC|nr:glycine receptor subunit alpha-2 [Trichonephila inaurata madagascariensis]